MQPSAFTEPLLHAIRAIPSGRWAVGVSGGADSVALLSLLSNRTDLHLHITHLNHETRGEESDGDAASVQNLARSLNLPCTCAKLSEIEVKLPKLPNPSARYRAARLALFESVVQAEHLDGVILAHHADDQAETILQRLLRGSGPHGLHGMLPTSQRNKPPLRILRPLLTVSRNSLRRWLVDQEIPWREDSSNQSTAYLRNRTRSLLHNNPALQDSLLQLGSACAQWSHTLDRHAPILPETFATVQLTRMPEPVAHHAARRWLRERGADPESLNRTTTGRLIRMATDAATPPRQDFPGPLVVTRRKGQISVLLPST